MTYRRMFVPLQESGGGKKKKCIDTAFKNRPKAADPSDDWTDAQRGVLKLEYAQPPAAVKLVPQ